MTMTPAEIVADYKQAKQPMKQIAILADLNGVRKEQIVQILREAGAELPGNYAKRKPVEEPKAPNGKPSVYESALLTIAKFIKVGAEPEAFMEQVSGVLALVEQLEEDNG